MKRHLWSFACTAVPYQQNIKIHQITLVGVPGTNKVFNRAVVRLLCLRRCKQLFLQRQHRFAKPFSRLACKTNTLTWKRLLLCFVFLFFFSSAVRCVTFISRNIWYGHFLTPVVAVLDIPVGASRPCVLFVPVKHEASSC